MKTTVMSRDEGTLHALRELLGQWDSMMPIATIQGGVEQALVLMQSAQPPDVLMIETKCGSKDELAHLDALAEHFPNMTLVLLCKAPSPEIMQYAMRIGVRELLTLPVKQDELHEAMRRAHRRSQTHIGAAKAGRVLSWIGCKGGSGQTFLASNFAYALAHADGQNKVMLIDLNLQFGDAVLFLADNKPRFTVADLAKNPDRLDAALLHTSSAHITSSLDVLAAPENLEAAAAVKPEHVESIIRMAAQEYDYVVLDLGRTIDAITLRALDLSDDIFIIVQLTLPFIRDCKRMLEALEVLGQQRSKLRLLVNRYEPGGDISIDNLEQVLGRRVSQTIPNSYHAVATSVNQGKPITVIAKSDPVSKTLVHMSQDLVHGNEPAQKRNSLFGWLKHER